MVVWTPQACGYIPIAHMGHEDDGTVPLVQLFFKPPAPRGGEADIAFSPGPDTVHEHGGKILVLAKGA